MTDSINNDIRGDLLATAALLRAAADMGPDEAVTQVRATRTREPDCLGEPMSTPMDSTIAAEIKAIIGGLA